MCDALAVHHSDSLPNSLLSLLGLSFLRALYRFAVRSPLERLIACRVDGDVVAGALISHQPDTLSRRALFKTPLIWSVLSRFHARVVRQALFARPKLEWDDAAQYGKAEAAPELLALFCREDVRGKGIGGQLIDEIDRQLSAAGVVRYFVRTAKGQENPALRFYMRHGFILVGHLTAHGAEFALLMKQLAPDVKPGAAT